MREEGGEALKLSTGGLASLFTALRSVYQHLGKLHLFNYKRSASRTDAGQPSGASKYSDLSSCQDAGQPSGASEYLAKFCDNDV